MTLKLRMLSIGEAVKLVRAVEPEDLRPIDLLEFNDAVKGCRWVQDNFSLYLGCTLGLIMPDCRTYFVSTMAGQPVFLATSYARNGKGTGVKQLCGFGWSAADPIIPKRERGQIIVEGMRALVFGDKEATHFQCYVHNDNRDTLASWRLIERLYKHLLTVEFLPHEFNKDYTTVVIKKKSGAET